MILIIEGKFKDGKVELNEMPKGLSEAKVLVTFLGPAEPARKPQMMQFGQFSGPDDKMSNDEDFRGAEWRGDQTDGN